jgi:hypothetical protein
MNKQPLWLGVDPSVNVANFDEGSAEFSSGQRAGRHIHYEYKTELFAGVLLED